MIMRRRPLLRAAVVGGGAYAAGKHVARRQAAYDEMQAEQNARLDQLEGQPTSAGYQQPVAVPVQATPPPAPTSPMVDQLNQLAALHHEGVLSDEEFQAAKAKLLGG